jgi:hypothetical protein
LQRAAEKKLTSGRGIISIFFDAHVAIGLN